MEATKNGIFPLIYFLWVAVIVRPLRLSLNRNVVMIEITSTFWSFCTAKASRCMYKNTWKLDEIQWWSWRRGQCSYQIFYFIFLFSLKHNFPRKCECVLLCLLILFVFFQKCETKIIPGLEAWFLLNIMIKNDKIPYKQTEKRRDARVANTNESAIAKAKNSVKTLWNQTGAGARRSMDKRGE